VAVATAADDHAVIATDVLPPHHHRIALRVHRDLGIAGLPCRVGVDQEGLPGGLSGRVEGPSEDAVLTLLAGGPLMPHHQEVARRVRCRRRQGDLVDAAAAGVDAHRRTLGLTRSVERTPEEAVLALLAVRGLPPRHEEVPGGVRGHRWCLDLHPGLLVDLDALAPGLVVGSEEASEDAALTLLARGASPPADDEAADAVEGDRRVQDDAARVFVDAEDAGRLVLGVEEAPEDAPVLLDDQTLWGEPLARKLLPHDDPVPAGVCRRGDAFVDVGSGRRGQDLVSADDLAPGGLLHGDHLAHLVGAEVVGHGQGHGDGAGAGVGVLRALLRARAAVAEGPAPRRGLRAGGISELDRLVCRRFSWRPREACDRRLADRQLRVRGVGAVLVAHSQADGVGAARRVGVRGVALLARGAVAEVPGPRGGLNG